jgi:predicted Zn-dependent protease with MMP-like domain
MSMAVGREPDGDTIERLARRAVRRLPPRFREYLSDVVFRVEEFADAEQLHAVGLNNRWQLVGLYQGRPVSEQSISSTGDEPPIISLFRRPLLRERNETGDTLEDLVAHVIVHEVGHHFGLSDDQMHAIENQAD